MNDLLHSLQAVVFFPPLMLMPFFSLWACFYALYTCSLFLINHMSLSNQTPQYLSSPSPCCIPCFLSLLPCALFSSGFLPMFPCQFIILYPSKVICNFLSVFILNKTLLYFGPTSSNTKPWQSSFKNQDYCYILLAYSLRPYIALIVTGTVTMKICKFSQNIEVVLTEHVFWNEVNVLAKKPYSYVCRDKTHVGGLRHRMSENV